MGEPDDSDIMLAVKPANKTNPFLSMACGEWSVDQVVNLINQYKNSSAQMAVDGKPFVSTFEGPGWADNWGAVRDQTGGIFLVPDWASLGPHGVGEKLDIIDGACKPGRKEFRYYCCVVLIDPASLLGRVAESRPSKNDSRRGQVIQGHPRREEVYDGGQPLFLHQ